MAVELVYDRMFQIWVYSVGHAQLLLRSNRTHEIHTRVDVLFKGVQAIKLPATFHGLSVERHSMEHASELGVQLGAAQGISSAIFVVQGANFQGYVVAAAAFSHEDHGHFEEPSFFQKSFYDSIRV